MVFLHPVMVLQWQLILGAIENEEDPQEKWWGRILKTHWNIHLRKNPGKNPGRPDGYFYLEKIFSSGCRGNGAEVIFWTSFVVEEVPKWKKCSSMHKEWDGKVPGNPKK
jgi:hypothetical protein